MALQVQTFTNFDGGKWQAFKAKILADTGVNITGTEGTVVHGSFTFTYNYNPLTEVLQVQCLKKPLFIPAASIINGLAEEIADLVPVVAVIPVAGPVPNAE